MRNVTVTDCPRLMYLFVFWLLECFIQLKASTWSCRQQSSAVPYIEGVSVFLGGGPQVVWAMEHLLRVDSRTLFQAIHIWAWGALVSYFAGTLGAS